MSNTNFNFLLCFLWIFRETSNYHRCGRTDKGVSAFSQVKYYIKNSSYTDTKTLSQVKHYIKNSSKTDTKTFSQVKHYIKIVLIQILKHLVR
jgi:tRNA U38,U39,U40 pseudouridine synthase TruA